MEITTPETQITKGVCSLPYLPRSSWHGTEIAKPIKKIKSALWKYIQGTVNNRYHRSHCCMNAGRTTLLFRSNSITTRKPAAARNSTHPQPFNPLVYLFIPLHLLAYLQHLPLQLVEHHLPSDATTGCLKNITNL